MKSYKVSAVSPVMVAVVPLTVTVPPPETAYPVIALSPAIEGESQLRDTVVLPVAVETSDETRPGKPEAAVKLLDEPGEESREIPDFEDLLIDMLRNFRDRC